MPDSVLVLIDHADHQIRQASLETLAFGQKLASATGGGLSALLLGENLGDLSQQVSRYEVDRILVLDNPKLAEYEPFVYTDALVKVLQQESPELLLMAHIYQNLDLAPRLSGRLRTGLVTDTIGFRMENEKIIFTRQMFRNKVNADISIDSKPPWIVSMQAGAFSRDDLRAGSGQITDLAATIDAEPRRVSLEAYEATKGKVDLSKADVVVAVGRGIKKRENLNLIEELAELLGAEIGASRPVVDNEWLGRERQIGSSGQTVAPKLYLGVGISGAIQHIVGMKGSQCIVAINSDPNAPIFNVATYGIVGDLFQIVPALIKAIRESEK